MKYILPALLLVITTTSIGQSKLYQYYFDKNLNSIGPEYAVFYGTGQDENGLLKLMLYNNADKHLILIEHFTDSSLQLNDGLFTSFYINNRKESEGNYTNGKQDGIWQRWDSSGNIIDSSLYTKGEVELSSTYSYFPGGNIESIVFNDFKNHKYLKTSYDQNKKIISKSTSEKTDEDIIFIKTEIKASFPGGDIAWSKYIRSKLLFSPGNFNIRNSGKCLIQFIVNKDGKVSDIKALTMSNSKIADIAIKAIKDGPDWIPAQQNGRYVKSYRTQRVTLEY